MPSDTDHVTQLMSVVPLPPTVVQVSNLEQILSERDACGVGLIASLKQEATHSIVEQV